MELNRNRPETALKKRRHFKDGFTFWIKPSRMSELRAWLRSSGLKSKKHYLLSSLNSTRRILLSNSNRQLDLSTQYVISFREKDKAALFKLSWSECEVGTPDVILPLIRRVMPSIIAQDIIGVSPMTGPTGSIFAMRSNYAGNQGATSSSPNQSLSNSIRPDESTDESGSNSHL
jgi:hypothetical protein